MKRSSSAHFLKGITGTDAILQDGTPQIAFIGRSNVGKSSLINALTDTPGLARVGKKPGKTTEINIFLFRRMFYIVDLPGYGYARATPKEREKLKKLIVWYFTYSHTKIRTTVLVLDAVAGLTAFDEQMMAILREQDHPFIVVVNKVDKLTQKEIARATAVIHDRSGDAEVFLCSTTTGRGIRALAERLFA